MSHQNKSHTFSGAKRLLKEEILSGIGEYEFAKITGYQEVTRILSCETEITRFYNVDLIKCDKTGALDINLGPCPRRRSLRRRVETVAARYGWAIKLRADKRGLGHSILEVLPCRHAPNGKPERLICRYAMLRPG